MREMESQKPVDCMVERAGLLVCGKGGMECYGVVYNINTGQLVTTLSGLYGFSNVCMTSTGKEVSILCVFPRYDSLSPYIYARTAAVHWLPTVNYLNVNDMYYSFSP